MRRIIYFFDVVPSCKRANTLGQAYNAQIDAKKTARCRRVLVVTELFNTAVDDFDVKKSACCSQVLVVTELVVSGAHCICPMFPDTEISVKMFHVNAFWLIHTAQDRKPGRELNLCVLISILSKTETGTVNGPNGFPPVLPTGAGTWKGVFILVSCSP